MGDIPYDLTRHVVLVTGTESGKFGTAFAIHSDEMGTYLLTCRHVIDEVGDINGLLVAQQPATVVVSDSREGFDLAVVHVKSKLDIPLLEISLAQPSETAFRTAGFYGYGKSKLAQHIRGKIGERAEVLSSALNCRCAAWHLEIDNDEQLLHGYSGSPLINESGKAIGFISYKQDKTNRGLAFSIEALRHIWLEMPEQLARTFQRAALQATVSRSSKLPLMNMDAERADFERIASGEDTETRLIVINGKSGLGKTRLLEECKAIAAFHQLPMHVIALGQQTSVEHCLDQLMFRYGNEFFQRYEQIASTVGMTSVEDREKAITRAFFNDLSKLRQPARLVLFLDQYEKAHPEFKRWFTQVFAPYLSAQPTSSLVVLVAGQEPITTEQSWSGYRPIHLQGLSVEHFHKFVRDCNVDIPPDDVEKYHGLLQGHPKFFVDHVASLLKRKEHHG